MYKGRRIAVVVPAHNEAQHIGQVASTIPPYVDHLIIVDDSSRDNTAEVARAVADQRILVLQTPTNAGVGGATKLGYRKGLESDAQILVKMDGDGQMSSEHLPALLDA